VTHLFAEIEEKAGLGLNRPGLHPAGINARSVFKCGHAYLPDQ